MDVDRARSSEDDGAVVRSAPGVGAHHGGAARTDDRGARRTRLSDVSALDRDGGQGRPAVRGGMEGGEGLEAAASLGSLLETGRAGGKGHGASRRGVRAGARSARPRIRGGSQAAAGGGPVTGTDHRARAARRRAVRSRRFGLALAAALALVAQPGLSPGQPAKPPVATYEFNDTHFHLTNYIQE